MGKTAGRSISGIHDEVFEEEKGEDLARVKWMRI
jgi:hypothetical protein